LDDGKNEAGGGGRGRRSFVKFHLSGSMLLSLNSGWQEAFYFKDRSLEQYIFFLDFKTNKKAKNKIRKRKGKEIKSSIRIKPWLGSGTRLEVLMTVCACWASRAGRAHNAHVAFLSSI
jgi:hypothetical protein